MRVLILSGADIRGGAARVAHDLAEGLIARGHHAELHASTCTSGKPFVRELPPARRLPTGIPTKVFHRLGVNTLNLDSTFPFSLGRPYFADADIIHLHDLPGDFNLAALPWLSRIRPVVWTLHTLSPFTGNCLYPYTCIRFKDTCGRCPQFGQWPLDWLHRDGSRAVNLIRRVIYGASDFVPVGVSAYVAGEARKGMMRHQPVRTILNSVDTALYQPADKREAKRALGIDPDRFTIFFAVAGNLKDRRKGLDTILEALPLIAGERPFLLPTAVTDPAKEFKEVLADFDGFSPRHLSGAAALRSYYQAADVVWHPTLADTSSIVSLEAMACGTPVIASAVGGVPEIVREGVNGCLIPARDAPALARATLRLMGDPALRQRLARGARETVEAGFSQARFIEDHLRLYESILANRASRRS